MLNMFEFLTIEQATKNALMRQNTIEKTHNIIDTVGDGNCFFDAIIKVLNRLVPNNNLTVTKLRIICSNKIINMIDELEKDNDISKLSGVSQKIINYLKFEIVPKTTDIYAIDTNGNSKIKNLLDAMTPKQFLVAFKKYAQTIRQSQGTTILWGKDIIEGVLICQFLAENNITFNDKQLAIKVINIIPDQSKDESMLVVDYIDSNGLKNEPNPDCHYLEIYNEGNVHFLGLITKELDLSLTSKTNYGFLNHARIELETYYGQSKLDSSAMDSVVTSYIHDLGNTPPLLQPKSLLVMIEELKYQPLVTFNHQKIISNTNNKHQFNLTNKVDFTDNMKLVVNNIHELNLHQLVDNIEPFIPKNHPFLNHARIELETCYGQNKLDSSAMDSVVTSYIHDLRNTSPLLQPKSLLVMIAELKYQKLAPFNKKVLTTGNNSFQKKSVKKVLTTGNNSFQKKAVFSL